METLKDFQSREFPDQMRTLIQIGKEKNIQYLPELFSLYNSLTGDKTVDAMVEHTLRDILLENENETVERISTGTAKEKKLCLQVAAKKKFPSSVPTLVELAENEPDNGVLSEAFIAMSHIKDRRFLDVFHKFICHPNDIVSGISIEMAAYFKDFSAKTKLEEIVENAEADHNFETCSVCTVQAIEGLASLGDDECIRFLVSKIHHKNPTARRIVQEQLLGIGESILPFLEDIFTDDSPDKKIMAANTIGQLGKKKGGDILIAALDKGLAKNDSVRAAIYEAIGHIPYLKSLVCLTEGLNEENLQILIAVVSGVDHQLNPEIVKIIKDNIEKNDSRSQKTIQAVVSARTLNIFEHLYRYDTVRKRLIDAVLNSNDELVLETFAGKLHTMSGETVNSDMELILSRKIEKRDIRILAVDDSEPVRLFYRSVISTLSIETELAENGQIALERLESGRSFDLIITDLNMPVMDGIELTRKIRANPILQNIPIIIASTESDRSQRIMAEKSGVNGFISKPIESDLLKKKINSFFS